MNVQELQAEIEKAEKLILAELQRVARLADFTELSLHVTTLHVANLGGQRSAKIVSGVRIEAAL